MDSLRVAVFLPVVLISMVALGLILVSRGNIRKSRWGINLNPVNCPRCNRLMPTIRKPTSMSQACGAAGRANIAVVRWTNGDARLSFRDQLSRSRSVCP